MQAIPFYLASGSWVPGTKVLSPLQTDSVGNGDTVNLSTRPWTGVGAQTQNNKKTNSDNEVLCYHAGITYCQEIPRVPVTDS